MANQSKLPQELIDQVLDNIKDRRVLAVCSLVHRRWREHTQRNMISDPLGVKLVHHGHVESFFEMVRDDVERLGSEQPRGIGRHIRRLDIAVAPDCGPGEVTHTPWRLGQIFRYCTNMEVLEISRMTFDSAFDYPIFHSAARPSLTILRLSFNNFSAIHQMFFIIATILRGSPSLGALNLIRNNASCVTECLSQPFLPPIYRQLAFPQVNSLRVVGNHFHMTDRGHRLLAHLHTGSVLGTMFPGTTVLYVGAGNVSEQSCVGELISQLKTRLETLCVYGPTSSNVESGDIGPFAMRSSFSPIFSSHSWLYQATYLRWDSGLVW